LQKFCKPFFGTFGRICLSIFDICYVLGLINHTGPKTDEKFEFFQKKLSWGVPIFGPKDAFFSGKPSESGKNLYLIIFTTYCPSTFIISNIV
jgi:hypothetical protein